MALIQYLILNNRNKTDRDFLRKTHVQECVIFGVLLTWVHPHSDRLLCT